MAEREAIVARMPKVLSAVAGVCLIVGSVTVAFTAGSASAQSFSSTSCGYPTPCGHLGTGSGSAPPGGTITLSGHGYAPHTTVTVNICGIETITVQTNSAGDFTTKIVIPSGAVPGATCVITASGRGMSGEKLTTSTSVIVSSGITVPKSASGEPWASPLYWLLAGVAGLIGLGTFEVGRRRRFRSNT
ncbi:MAG TPA: hypothetical protein VEH29_01375 [Acidimicrobiales bacterium]|nr:hypothetical protein [Acidimicrobiales bacterium]